MLPTIPHTTQKTRLTGFSSDRATFPIPHTAPTLLPRFFTCVISSIFVSNDLPLRNAISRTETPLDATAECTNMAKYVLIARRPMKLNLELCAAAQLFSCSAGNGAGWRYGFLGSETNRYDLCVRIWSASFGGICCDGGRSRRVERYFCAVAGVRVDDPR